MHTYTGTVLKKIVSGQLIEGNPPKLTIPFAGKRGDSEYWQVLPPVPVVEGKCTIEELLWHGQCFSGVDKVKRV